MLKFPAQGGGYNAYSTLPMTGAKKLGLAGDVQSARVQTGHLPALGQGTSVQPALAGSSDITALILPIIMILLQLLQTLSQGMPAGGAGPFQGATKTISPENPAGDGMTTPPAGDGMTTPEEGQETDGDIAANASSGQAPNLAQYKLSMDQIHARYYIGGKPGARAPGEGNSKNVRQDLVASDMAKSIKQNWSKVDPTIRKMFDSGQADQFFGPNVPPGFKNLPGWKKYAMYSIAKAKFETAGTLDPTHKDPGDQAWGLLSIYNKGAGLPGFPNMRTPEAEAAFSSPGVAAVMDSYTMKSALEFNGNPQNRFDRNRDPLSRIHFQFASVDQNNYNFQKDSFVKNMFTTQRDTINGKSVYQFVSGLGI